MKGEAAQYGFGRAVRTLRQLTATPGSRQFDPVFCRLYARAAFVEDSSSASVGTPARTFTESFEELKERLARLEAERTGPSLLREKIEIYRHMFSGQNDIPEQQADVFFMDLLRSVGALLEMPGGSTRELRTLDGVCLGYADLCRQRMTECNGAAERKVRCSAENGEQPAQDGAARELTRAALAAGSRAAAVLAWVQEPAWTSEKLYAGFEQRVEDVFCIDAGSLEDMSDDGKTAVVRVDRRLVLARKITVQLCRSFVRLDALEKAGRCEQLLDAMAFGYTPRKRHSLVAFEDENWKNILVLPVVYDEE
jgi:hypothetical protein